MVLPLKARGDNFLSTGSIVDFWTFNPQRKEKLLEILSNCWPNVSAACKAIGISHQTFDTHLKRDVKFCKAVEEIKRAKLDAIEGVSETSAMDVRRGFLDRAMILRAHRPELYDRAKVVKIEGYKMGAAEARQRLAGLEGEDDAEIVKAYARGKERKQRKMIVAGEGEAGKTGGAGEAEAGG